MRIQWKLIGLLFFCECAIWSGTLPAESKTPTHKEASVAMSSAVQFFRKHAGYQGAYVFRVSSDLQLREGEGKANAGTGWLEPPGTPSVGLAYLNAYKLTGETYLLDAAQEVADALIRGQLVSGGWSESIELIPEHAQHFKYRVGQQAGRKLKNTSTLDDDKTQSALRFLMLLDFETKMKNDRLHESIEYGLERLIDEQYPNGAWPQKFGFRDDEAVFPIKRASYPESWSRTYAKQAYSMHYTLNDNTISDTITTMLLAFDIYNDQRFFESALRGGDFLLLAQMPDPQPAWAQQYNAAMHPVWARKFEPPAVSGGESQQVAKTLLVLYRRTGDARYLHSVEKAVNYLSKSIRKDGRLARFYELKTNRPLYFSKSYELTYDDSDMPTHYGFVVRNQLDRIMSEADKLTERISREPITGISRQSPSRPSAKASSELSNEAANAIKSLDARGAWVEPGIMKNYENPTGRVIESKTFTDRLLAIARFINVKKK